MQLNPIYRGDSVTYTVEFLKDDVALDLTGATVKFTVKENIEDSYANAKIKKTITTFTENKCIIKLLPSDTSTLTNNIYVFDIELTDYASDKSTVLSGELPVNLDVTNG